ILRTINSKQRQPTRTPLPGRAPVLDFAGSPSRSPRRLRDLRVERCSLRSRETLKKTNTAKRFSSLKDVDTESSFILTSDSYRHTIVAVPTAQASPRSLREVFAGICCDI